MPPFAPLKLGPKNLKGGSTVSSHTDSLADLQSRLDPVCRPVLNQYVHTHEEFLSYTKELFDIIKAGHLDLSVYEEYPLTTEGVRQTHLDLSKSPALRSEMKDGRADRVRRTSHTSSQPQDLGQAATEDRLSSGTCFARNQDVIRILDFALER